MGIHREPKTQLFPADFDDKSHRQAIPRTHPLRSPELRADLLKAWATKGCLLLILSSLGECGILRQPAFAQSREGLGWMGTMEAPRGSRSEFSTPVGYTCRYEQGDRPSLNIGVGITEPPVINGISGYERVIGPRVADPAPVAGIVLTIPLGVDEGTNCKQLEALEMGNLKLEYAKQMMMDGLITEDQLQAIVDQHYKRIKD